jgi:hypothetical protein
LFQKNGTHICVPYLARQVSWSWHTSDGCFLKTKKKGYSHSSLTSILQLSDTSWVCTMWLNQHMPSVLDTNQDRVKNCSRFSNNSNLIMIRITLPVIIITNVCYNQLARVLRHPGHITIKHKS